ncbi:hypothetical protein [Brevibacillus reuszeri]|nr:hypothetical protein [Brevibacillus reuszeri]MED1861630.1 hypothetical protein [Brevibacillus reuszeri]
MSRNTTTEDWFKLWNPKFGAEVKATLKFIPHWERRGFIVIGKTTRPDL